MFSSQEIENLMNQAFEVSFQKFHDKKFQEANLILSQALKINPDNNRIIQLLALTQYALGDFNSAIINFQKSLKQYPDDAENLNNLGLCYSGLGQFDEAINCIKKSLKLKPTSSVYSNLGLQYKHKKNYKKAISLFHKSLSLKSDASTWGMLGGCYGDLRELDEAKKCFLTALEINPNFAQAHLDLSHVYQLQGEYDKSWNEYQWRFEVFEQLKVWKEIYEPDKLWTGQSLEKKRIIIHGEQGHGDCIHFFRYLKFLNGYKIIHCSQALKTLFEPYVDEIYTVDPTLVRNNKLDLPQHDYHCSIMSLPHILNNPVIPNDPYIECDKKLDLQDYTNYFKIGIVWAGNPQHPNDCNRSCKLNLFKEIHDLPNVKLFSLMKDLRPRAYRFHPEPIDLTENTENMRIVDMSSHIDSFKDTATIINSLDLVITVDSAILHLCGSMGKKTWALIPWNNDWRWGLNSKKTIWYPSVTLFRQKKLGNWKDVFEKMNKKLSKYLILKQKDAHGSSDILQN